MIKNILLIILLLQFTSCKKDNCGSDSDLVPVVFSFSFTDSNGNDIFLDENSIYDLESLKFLNDYDGIININNDTSCFIMEAGGNWEKEFEFIPLDLDTIRFVSYRKDKCSDGFRTYFNDSLVCEDCGGQCYILYK